MDINGMFKANEKKEEKSFSQVVQENGGSITTPNATQKVETNVAPTNTTQKVETKVAPTNIFATLTMDKINTSSFDGLPVGEYTVEVEEIKVKLASNGKPLTVVKYRVIDGELTKRVDFETIWLTNKDGEINDRNIGKLARTLQVINKCDEEKAKEATLILLKTFAEKGQEELVINKENGIPSDSTGKLKISTYTYTNNKDVEVEGTNYSFKAL